MHGKLKQLVKDGKVSPAIVELAPEAGRQKGSRSSSAVAGPAHTEFAATSVGAEALRSADSGIFKGGCMRVVVDRLKKSGSRWSVECADGAVAIRRRKINNRIEDFFQWRAAA